MISTPLRSKILTHTRSSSLPSRSHPLIPQFNDHLQKLQTSDSTLPSIAKNLTHLLHLYSCVDDLLLLPHTRRVFARESGEKWVEQVLDGYLGLVDACATAKDLLSHAKEYLLRLLSLLRRRRDSDDDLCALLASRKAAKKVIQKSLRNISSLRSKPSVVALDRDGETIAVVSMLREAESATLDLIETLLLSVSGAKSSPRLSGWRLVSRLIHSRKSSSSSSSSDALEFGEVDATLEKAVGFRTWRCDELQLRLRDTEASLGVIEGRVENLFRRLIKTRVSLLNMHSQQ